MANAFTIPKQLWFSIFDQTELKTGNLIIGLSKDLYRGSEALVRLGCVCIEGVLDVENETFLETGERLNNEMFDT